jgi:hypothetical protein
VAYRLGELSASAWVQRGDQNLARYGFTTNGWQISVELKSGEKLNLDFGGVSPAQYPYAAVVLNGETWVFEFPLALYQFLRSYLAMPVNAA